MSEEFHVVQPAAHNALVEAAYLHRGFNQHESEAAARFGEYAARHGVRTHNAIKALHLDEHFGSSAGGCNPCAEIESIPSRFAACEVWNANKKIGQASAYAAIDRAIELADKYGIGQVSVDNAFHYLWGGGYVMEAAKRGYIAYTNCTAALTEVVPFQGKFPTLGTNPHSWGFPTTNAIGFPIVIDWATSVVSMGRVQQFIREGAQLPAEAGVDSKGLPTTDPNQLSALVPFGAHKGYGLSLINELLSALIGASLPTLRSKHLKDGDQHTPTFYFQVIHPEALSSNDFPFGRNQSENLKVVVNDIFSGGNHSCILPGQVEADFAQRTKNAGGLLFSENEIHEFNRIAEECRMPKWVLEDFQQELQ